MNILIKSRSMSSLFFEKQQVNCNCFENSPKPVSRIFRTDSGHDNKDNNKQVKQPFPRNVSEQSKPKKKSLKKERQISTHGSEKTPNQKEETNSITINAGIQTAFSAISPRMQQKVVDFDHLQPISFTPIQSQRLKLASNYRTQRPLAVNLLIVLPTKYKRVKFNPTEIHSHKVIFENKEYEKKVSEQFLKDLQQYKLNMQKGGAKQLQLKLNIKKKKESLLVHKLSLQNTQYADPPSQIRHPATQHIIPVVDGQKNRNRVSSFRSNCGNNSQKISIKKDKNRIFPKQIQSENDSNSQADSDKLSEVVDWEWGGFTRRRGSFSVEEKVGKPRIARMQTMASQQSQLQNSQVNTLAEFSNIFTSTSPRSLYNNKPMAFGGSHKYRVSGMSYQHINQMKRLKASSSRDINL